jgi:hypothetical protein
MAVVVVVRSLEEIMELEVQVGVGAEVEVRGPLLKLCDAPAMRNRLKKLVRNSGWRVVGAFRLEPLIPIAQAVNEANKKVSELLPLFDTDKTPSLAANARDLRRRTNGLSYYATELQRLGKEVLAEATSLGDDLEEIVTLIRARKVTIEFVHKKLCAAKDSCSEVYNMETPLEDDDEEGN